MKLNRDFDWFVHETEKPRTGLPAQKGKTMRDREYYSDVVTVDCVMCGHTFETVLPGPIELCESCCLIPDNGGPECDCANDDLDNS